MRLKNISPDVKSIIQIGMVLIGIFYSAILLASPVFNITTPNKSYVTSPGGVVYIPYTVTNNSGINMSSMSYYPAVPASIVQGPSTTCGSTLLKNASCSVLLTVAISKIGSLSINLGVCGNHGNICSTTDKNNFVQVSVSQNQIAYVANNDHVNAVVSICPVLANGSLGVCTPHSDPLFSSPGDIVINAAGTFAYVNNTNNFTNISIATCPVLSDGTLSACTSSLITTDSFYSGLRLNLANTILYYTQYDNNVVSACPINSNGSLGACNNLSDPTFQGLEGRVTFNHKGSIAYLTNFNNNSISICPVNSDGSFGACTAFFDPAISSPLGSDINITDTFLYIPNDGTSNLPPFDVAVCPINSDGSLNPCTSSTDVSFNFSDDQIINLFMQTSNGFGYIPNGGGTSPLASVSVCPFQSNGSLGICVLNTDVSFNNPDGIWISTIR